MGLTANGTTSAASFPKAELNINAAVDNNVSVALELDSEGGDWATRNVSVDDFRAKVNVFGALGLDLPVSLNWTVGYFDTYFTNWNYVSRSGEEFYYYGPQGAYLWDLGPQGTGAWELDVAYGDFALKYWGDLDFSSMAFAVSGKIASMVNFLVGYSGDIATFGQGGLWAEAGLSLADLGPVSLTVPVTFTYDLGASQFAWSSGVAADVSMLHVSIGVGGLTGAAFKNLIPEVSVKPIDGLDVYVIGKLDFDSAAVGGAFQSVDLGASYNFGAMKFSLGGVIAGDPAVTTSLNNDNFSITGSGLYMAWYVAY